MLVNSKGFDIFLLQLETFSVMFHRTASNAFLLLVLLISIWTRSSLCVKVIPQNSWTYISKNFIIMDIYIYVPCIIMHVSKNWKVVFSPVSYIVLKKCELFLKQELSSQENESSIHEKVKVVEQCPYTKNGWIKAAEQKNCTGYSSNRPNKPYVYHCVINEWANATLEVCAVKILVICKLMHQCGINHVLCIIS